MSQATTTFLPETVAELLAFVGDLPAERVRLRPMPGTATEADVIAIYDREKRLCELVDGVLVEKTVGMLESHLAIVVASGLHDFVKRHDRGFVLGADGMLRLAPGLVRIPDVSFISWEQVPNHVIPDSPIADLHPDLAVEILSRGNTKREMERKLADYFQSGARLVWYIDPRSRSAVVYEPGAAPVQLDATGTLDGRRVLPGFSLPLAELFAELPGN